MSAITEILVSRSGRGWLSGKLVGSCDLLRRAVSFQVAG